MNLDTLARETPLAELPKLIGALAEASAIATLRLTTPTAPTVEPEVDRLLSAEEASVRCGLTPAQLVRRRDLPFRRRVGKLVRFSERGIRSWQRRSAA